MSNVRPEVAAFVAKGRLPPEDHHDEREFELRHEAIERITPPVTNEEAYLLATAFDPDGNSCHGIAWTVLHLIETAGPLDYDRLDLDNEWHRRLRDRFQRSKTDS